MKNNEEKLYLDNDGYQRLLEEIDLLKAKLAKNGKEKGEAYSGAVGDGWHDNFAFDEANMQERMILGQLRECYLKLERAEIVEKHDDDTLVDVNDIVTVDMIFGPDDSEELEFKLVGSVGAHTSDKSGIQEVSINSPLGKSVYHKKVGENASYKVESRVFNVEIISKISEKELESGIQRKKTR